MAQVDGPIVSSADFWMRELGAVYRSDTPWLSVAGDANIPKATAVLDGAGEDTFTLLWIPDPGQEAPPEVPGWAPSDPDVVHTWLGVEFRLTEYHRQESNVRS